ncbi:hypothetical protein FPQ18DRAFT_307770 [Pyronema domesticum]|nr:hypothetical protein FPQ18DRAFT_307770 [Pyronema domesticum]
MAHGDGFQAIKGVADNYRQIVDEVAQIPNVPAFNQGNQMQFLRYLQQKLVHGQQRLARAQDTIAHVQVRIMRRLDRVEQRPTTFVNEAPLRYPDGVPLDNLSRNEFELQDSPSHIFSIPTVVVQKPVSSLFNSGPSYVTLGSFLEYYGKQDVGACRV